MYRLHPLWRRVRALVDEGAVGELLTIQAFFSYRNVDPGEHPQHRRVRRRGADGHRLLPDQRRPLDVRRRAGRRRRHASGATRAFGTDVLTSAVLDFGGRQATFTCSTQIEDDQRVHLVGTAGRLVVEIPFNIPPDRPTRIVRAAGGDPPVAPDLEIIEVAGRRPVRRAGRRLLDRRARRLAGPDPARATRSATWR